MTTLAVPPRRRRRWLRRILLGLGVLLLGLVLLVVFVIGTNPGARLLLSQVLPRLPLTVEIASVEGKLLGPLTLRDIRVENELTAVDVGLLRYDIAVTGLFRGRIRITEIEVGDVSVEARAPAARTESEPDTTAAKPFVPPDLPPIILDLALLRDLEVLLPDTTRLVVEEARITGEATDYRIEVGGHAEGPALPATVYSLEGHGTLRDFVLDLLRLELLDGTVELRAEAAWYPALTWTAEARVRGLDPGAFPPAAEFPGSLDLDLATAGALDPELSANLAITGLGGTVRELPLRGGLRAEARGGTARLDSLDLGWGPLTVTASGTFDGAVTADFSLGAGDLSPLDPRLSGGLSLTGHAEGVPEAIVARVDGAGGGLGFETTGLDSLILSARGGLDPSEPFDVSLVALGIHRDTTRVDSVGLLAAGTRAEHRADLRVRALDASLDVVLAGGLVDSTWTGALDTLTAIHPAAGTWALAAPAPITVGPAGGKLDSLRLESEGSALLLAGEGTATGAWSGAFRLENLDLQRIPATTPEEISYEGVVRAEARFSGEGTRMTGEAHAGVDGLALTLATGDTVRIVAPEAALEVAVDDTALTARTVLALDRDTEPLLRFELAARIAGFSGADSIPPLPLEGSISANLEDLSRLEGIHPLIQDVGGRVEADFALQGTVGAPVLPGSFRLVDGRLGVPEFGIELADLQVSADGDPQGGFRFDGDGRMGEGTLHVEGSAPSVPSAANPARIHLVTDRARLIDTPEIEVYLDSDLQVRATPDTVEVTGELTIPEASIELVETPPSAVGPSPDVQFVGPGAVEKAPLAVPVVKLKITLGDEIFFRGLNYASRVEGSLNIRQIGTDPGQGTGEIRLTDGYYQAYGQDLKIDRGRVIFSGPLVNPGLDVTAYRECNDGTEAGVRITGTAENMVIEIYSDPSLPQGEALSYLMTGRGMSSASNDQKARVADAAAVLGSTLLSGTVASRTGLDEARIETGDTAEEASLVVGKYLNPRLFVSYGMGLFERSSSFRARYFLNPKWSVQTETGTATGADVLYRVETGK